MKSIAPDLRVDASKTKPSTRATKGTSPNPPAPMQGSNVRSIESHHHIKAAPRGLFSTLHELVPTMTSLLICHCIRVQKLPKHSSSDSAFVAPGAIPWLLVTVVPPGQAGPTGTGKLAETTFIQRLNTSGGFAPSIGCASPSDLGNKAFVPYTADYFFYK